MLALGGVKVQLVYRDGAAGAVAPACAESPGIYTERYAKLVFVQTHDERVLGQRNRALRDRCRAAARSITQDHPPRRFLGIAVSQVIDRPTVDSTTHVRLAQDQLPRLFL